MKHISTILRNLFCKHTATTFVRNVGGDEQTVHYVAGGGLDKSEWKCNDCGCKVYKSFRV